jgi:methyl coenzyme M reductase alpha subunit
VSTARYSSRGGLKCRAPGVEPVFPEKRQAINYAQERARFRSGEIRILDSSGNVERVIPFDDTNRKL